jgi:DnaB-like helicase C terminal domain
MSDVVTVTQLSTVMTGDGLFHAMAPPPVRKPPVGSGLAERDRLTGGLAGSLLLTGLPGRGRSVLASQWAIMAALEGRHVTLLSGRPDLRTLLARFVASTGSVPVQPLLTGRSLSQSDLERVKAAQERLAEVDLRFDAHELPGRRPSLHDVVVIDDWHLAGPRFRSTWLSATAELLIATAPLDLACVGALEPAPRLRRT